MVSPDQVVIPAAERCLQGVFRERVEQHPERVAIDDGSRTVTFGELDVRASAIAQQLLDLGLPPDRPVAFSADTAIETTVAALGILKAGMIVVGMDPHHPPERRVEQLRHAEASALIVEPRLSYVSEGMSQIPCLDPTDVPASHPSVCVEVDAGAPARLAYTSGTTGPPKATIHRHRTDLYICLFVSALPLTENDRCGMTFSGMFQATIGYPFGALLQGATLCPFEIRHETRTYLQWLRDSRVTMIHAVPTVIRRLLAPSVGDAGGAPDLRLIQIGGEASSGEDVEWLRSVLGSHITVAHAIGSGEASLWGRHVITPGDSVPPGPLPVGHAPVGKVVLVVGEDGSPVPDGVPGHAVVRSRYVSSGYWRDPERTEQTFRTSPHDDRMIDVHHADVVRRDADGALWHLGRGDSNVKVEGALVDVAEVEIALRAAGQLADAVVVQRSGAARLDAFIVPGRGPLPPLPELRRRLAALVPATAIPAHFHVVGEIPQTSTGKADRRALSDLAQAAAADAVEGTDSTGGSDPDSVLLRELAVLWGRVLQRAEPVSVDADWFELGGSSVQAATMMVELSRAHDVDLPITTLLEASTVRQLAGVVEARRTLRDPWSPLVPIRTTGTRVPLFAIHALFGSALLFEPLARHLGDDQPVYGLQSEALSGQPGATSLEAMAATYREAIVQTWPDGPYLLFGQSFGGTVAFEIARQLLEDGRVVALVAMGDTVNPARLHGIGGLRTPRQLLGLNRARAEAEGAGRVVRTAMGQLLWRAAELRRRLLAQAALTSGGRIPPDLRASYVRYVNLRAHRAYRPPRLDVRVLMVRSADRDPDPTRGWAAVVDRIEVRDINTSHGGIVRDPAVARTAAILREAIDSALVDAADPAPNQH